MAAPTKKLSLPTRILIAALDRMMPLIRHRIQRDNQCDNAQFPYWLQTTYAISPDVLRLDPDTPFMTSSAAMARDFYHPEFRRLCDLIGSDVHLHRKLWEFVFIIHHALQSSVVRPGARGLAFGVGRESLPALSAEMNMRITATDAPHTLEAAAAWSLGEQHSAGLDALPCGRLDRATLAERLEWRPCDMNAIAPDLRGYDLCWSSCALEHLGSIALGLEFIVNSVECLAPGGVAIHTTELNLSSNRETVESGETVLFRRRDLEAVSERLRAAGHSVMPFRVEPDSFVMDSFVDTPPYPRPHLRVALLGHVSTSAGLVIRKAG
ncbi:hypothetical protein [Sphingomonas quercus]|uniref:Methyltransferase type 11 domain-containing protein n=1 Tax=Sphingomonas quercus TaxID=2842451 RepID=A0ABS6BEI2_9SPHN|nr:hypothetical protein [Sphingomonas quercus]MBU3076725.1 hypothetical protein [Sphingomonas quercus]